MASVDWGTLTNSLSIGVIDRGVTAGITPPNGGGTFVYGFNSLAQTPGCAGLYTGQVNFAPMAKGGSVRGAVKRGVGSEVPATNIDYSPFFFIGAQAADTTTSGYLLGLSDEGEPHIVLRKGILASGVLASAVGSNGVLRRSTAIVAPGAYVHLRLDMVVNLNGDVILKCFQSDLAANLVSAPVWTAIPGMADFVDDALGVNSGSPAFTSGYAGFGFQSKAITRRAFFDQLEVLRQT